MPTADTFTKNLFTMGCLDDFVPVSHPLRPVRSGVNFMMMHAKQVAHEQAPITLGADKRYNAAEFIEALTDMKVLPHVAQNTANRKSAQFQIAKSVRRNPAHAVGDT